MLYSSGVDKFSADSGVGLAGRTPDVAAAPGPISRALPAMPMAGLVALLMFMHTYAPVDQAPFMLGGMALMVAAELLIVYVQKRFKSGADVGLLFPATLWLAAAPAMLAVAMLLNGALDRSPVERHTQVVMRKWYMSGKHTSYHVQCTSWRPDQPFEKLSASRSPLYAQLHVGNSITVEVHKGALGIPWIGAIYVS